MVLCRTTGVDRRLGRWKERRDPLSQARIREVFSQASAATRTAQRLFDCHDFETIGQCIHRGWLYSGVGHHGRDPQHSSLQL